MPPRATPPVHPMTTEDLEAQTTTLELLGPPTLDNVMACALAYLQTHASPEALYEIGLLFSDNHRQVAWARMSVLVLDSMNLPAEVAE